MKKEAWFTFSGCSRQRRGTFWPKQSFDRVAQPPLIFYTEEKEWNPRTTIAKRERENSGFMSIPG
jgi:hypothetical protein